jgi:sugar lactone lactonase YvrE
MRPIVWDTRKCHVGEGPVVTGVDNCTIHWVDILNNKVLWRNLESNQSGEFQTAENVSFVLPRKNGGWILGNATGPDLMNPDGSLLKLPGRFEADGSVDPLPMRWNDAKVGPGGEVWIGTSAYGAATDRIGLHRLSADGKSMRRVLSGMGLSNGLDWSPDVSIFYLVDTVNLTLYAFDYTDGEISNQRAILTFDPAIEQYPDGLAVDSEGGFWIAFWNGSCIRHYSADLQLKETIDFPVRFVSSCVFAGSDFKTLVVTTATGDNGWHDDHQFAGAVFTLRTDVAGKAPYVFNN